MLGALLSATLAVAPAPWAPGGPSLPEDLIVSLVTFAPGDDIPSWWGHTALVVEDTRLQHGRLYNYGMFDFTTGFVHKFLQGRLEFWVGEAPIGGTYALYQELDRDIRIQQLDLNPQQRRELAASLALNVMPENREYLYHHYNDNCSTRPRDMIDRAIGGALTKASVVPARMSLREHTRRYSAVFAPMSLVLDYMQNDELDRPITQREEAFLPDELERQLDALTVDGRPAVARKVLLYESKVRRKVPEQPPYWNLWLLVVSALAGAGVFAARRTGRKLVRVALGTFLALEGVSWGVLGVALFTMSIFTDQQVTHRNENLFLINPITFALLPLGAMLAWGSARGERGLRWVSAALAVTGLLGIATKVLPMFDQQNWNLICLVVPLSLATAAAFWRKR